jgi:hypothetical protein
VCPASHTADETESEKRTGDAFIGMSRLDPGVAYSQDGYPLLLDLSNTSFRANSWEWKEWLEIRARVRAVLCHPRVQYLPQLTVGVPFMRLSRKNPKPNPPPTPPLDSQPKFLTEEDGLTEDLFATVYHALQARTDSLCIHRAQLFVSCTEDLVPLLTCLGTGSGTDGDR